MQLGKMTYTNEGTNPPHFGSDPADNQIKINPDLHPKSLGFGGGNQSLMVQVHLALVEV